MAKLLIYQICPMVAKKLVSMENQFPTEPMLVDYSPLNSLITGQIQLLSRYQSIYRYINFRLVITYFLDGHLKM